MNLFYIFKSFADGVEFQFINHDDLYTAWNTPSA